MNWAARSCGNMTLGVFDEDGFQIVKIDMLKQKTMKAETDGELLCRALNDLTLIAAFPKLQRNEMKLAEVLGNLPHAESGVSPFPWRVEYTSEKRKLKIFDKFNILVTDREYPKSKSDEDVESIVLGLMYGVNLLPKGLG